MIIRKNIEKERLNEAIYVIALSLVFTFGITYRLIDARVAVLFIIPLCAFMYMKKRLFPLDLPFLFLVGGLNLYAVNQYRVDPMLRLEYTELVFFWILPIVYLFGKAVIGEDKKQVDAKTHTVIFALGIGMYIQALLDYYAHYTYPTDVVIHAWPSFWLPNNIESRNIYDLNFIAITASLFYLVIERKKYKKLFVFAVIAEAVAIYFNVINQGRTNIVMLVMIIFILAMVYCFTHWKELSTRTKAIFIGLGSVAICGVTLLTVLINHDKIDAGLSENDKYWARGGGILKNIRFRMAFEGLYKGFRYGKGGWEVVSGDINSTHNTFLEYARDCDIIVSMLIMIFALITLIIGFSMLIKYGKRQHILYLIVGTQLAFFIYFLMEPSGFQQKKLFAIYIFITGVLTGYSDVLTSSDYRFINPKPVKTYTNISMLLLSYAMINMVYIDYWCDRLSISLLLVPIIAYLFGEKIKQRGWVLVILAITAMTLTIVTFLISRKSDYWIAGYVYEPFTKIVLSKSYIIGLVIIPLSMIIGIVTNKLRLHKVFAAMLSFIFAIIIYWNKLGDGRLQNIKEALSLWIKKPWGSFVVTSSPLLSSHDMWLDYARDYGIMVAVPLILFVFTCFIRFVMLVLSQKRNNWIDHVVVSSFVLYNVYFALESIGYERKYIFYMALIMWGMLSAPRQFESDW